MTASGKRIAIETTIAAPVAEVWSAFTTPADITQWNFASEDWYCPRAFADLRVGGIYNARMEARDGSSGFDFEAVYEKLEPLEAITLALNDGRKASTTFETVDEGTKVMTVFDAEDQNPFEMQRDGWQAILDNFRDYVENSEAKQDRIGLNG